MLVSCELQRREARYDTGELKSEWYQEGGLKNGELKEYYKSGKLKRIQHWKAGILDGEEIAYHENGRVAQQINYYKGQRVDAASFYLPSGALVEIHYYDSLGVLEDYKKFDNIGQQTKEMSLIIVSDRDTIYPDEVYRGRVRLGNVSNEHYQDGVLIIANEWSEGLPLDTMVSVSSGNNDYPFELKNHRIGENSFRGCIFYKVPLDTVDGTLLAQKCFEQSYYTLGN